MLGHVRSGEVMLGWATLGYVMSSWFTLRYAKLHAAVEALISNIPQ